MIWFALETNPIYVETDSFLFGTDVKKQTIENCWEHFLLFAQVFVKQNRIVSISVFERKKKKNSFWIQTKVVLNHCFVVNIDRSPSISRRRSTFCLSTYFFSTSLCCSVHIFVGRILSPRLHFVFISLVFGVIIKDILNSKLLTTGIEKSFQGGWLGTAAVIKIRKDFKTGQ